MGTEPVNNSCRPVFDPAENTPVNIVQCDIVPVASALYANLFAHRSGPKNDNSLQLPPILFFSLRLFSRGAEAKQFRKQLPKLFLH